MQLTAEFPYFAEDFIAYEIGLFLKVFVRYCFYES